MFLAGWLPVLVVQFLFALVTLLVPTGPIRRRFDAAARWIEKATRAVLSSLGLKLAFSRASS